MAVRMAVMVAVAYGCSYQKGENGWLKRFNFMGYGMESVESRSITKTVGSRKLISI